MPDALAKGKKPTGPDAKTEGDAFIAGTVRAWEWVQENLQVVLVAVAGLAIAALGVLYYVNFRASVQEQAAADLAALRMAVSSPEQAVPRLEAYIDRFAGTKAADEARLVLGRLYLDTGQPQEAAAALREVEQPPGHPVGYAAALLLANASEAAGDTAAALATWRSLGESARFAFQRREARSHVAAIVSARGELDAAAAILEEIAAEAARADEPAEAAVYRIRLGEINARRGAPAAN